MPHLFEPFTLRGVTLRNRIGVSPMCQYSCRDGMLTDWHLVHLGSRAIGGAGLVMVEATAVEAIGRISPGDSGLWNDDQIEPLRRVATFLKEHGAVPAIQLAHAGRKASAALPWKGGASLSNAEGGWETIGPSALAFGDNLTKIPREMTLADIERVRGAFKAAARRAVEAGFEWLEFHAAHGYLANSFLSPLSNKRTDQYGGSFENRVRFLVEAVNETRAVWPERYPLSVRISAVDWEEEGWKLEDSIQLAKTLKDLGVDLIDCSSGGVIPNPKKIPIGPGYQVPFAEAIKAKAAIATAAVGMITEPKQADEIIRNGQADIVLLARQMLRDPYWPVHAARALGQKEACPLPVQYARA
jgi:2,4-dienoyl-CoA reductase-like NADH-dependent reductase (Old Yellow Enzyme family)